MQQVIIGDYNVEEPDFLERNISVKMVFVHPSFIHIRGSKRKIGSYLLSMVKYPKKLIL